MPLRHVVGSRMLLALVAFPAQSFVRGPRLSHGWAATKLALLLLAAAWMAVLMRSA